MASTQHARGAFSDLRDELARARERAGRLFNVVKTEYLYERPIPERHRIIFYLGHLEAFDWNLLREASGCRAPWRPELDKLFAFGIDPVDGGLPTDRPEEWPRLEEVRQYNEEIRQELDTGIERALGAAKGNGAEIEQLMHVAIEHRLMHEETLSYMLQQLPYEQKRSQEQAPTPAAHGGAGTMVEIPEGRVTLGLSRSDAATFGWDNEYETHQVDVPAFAIDRYMVTNGEYRKFVEAGGYENRELWTASAWEWRCRENIRHPLFWKSEGGRWLWRGMFEEIPLPADWPVYVSHAEASAYARWAGKKLPSEAQWQRAAYGTPEGKERAYPWGNEAPTALYGNFNFARWDPAPANAYPESSSAFGVEGLLGNGWEWTASAFGPFPGFAAFPFYPGYSANFFDGKHFTMKGGSSRTATCMLRRTFRNWFQAHYPYVYAGFRCVSA
jgi:ergothioneine biosynthesis protein EgtB